MRASVAFMAISTCLLWIAACGATASPPQTPAPAATYGAAPPGYPQPTDPQAPPGYPPANYSPGYATAAPAYPPPAPAPVYPAAPAPTYAPPAPVPTYAPPAPAPAPQPPAPAATGTMATPGLLALPCQSDATCGLHHCNTQYGKCAFPCQTAADCIAPNQCVMGVCVPGGGF